MGERDEQDLTPAIPAGDLQAERFNTPEDIERDGVLLRAEVTLLCQCGTEVTGMIEIDRSAADFHPDKLPSTEITCPTCTAEIQAFGAGWADKRCVIPGHVAFGQLHVELVDDEADDEQPADEQQAAPQE